MVAPNKNAPAVEGTGRSRSPNFPAVSLPDAIKKVKAIYDKDGRGAVSAGVVLEHLGYGKNMSGSAGRMISALRQYGLLDDIGDDKYRVSEDAFHILTLSETSGVRRAAITRSGQKPPVFRDLLASYPDRLPSDSALRDYLIADKKFNPVSVDTFIRAFRATVEFAYLAPGAYDPNSGSPEDEAVNERMPEVVNQVGTTAPPIGPTVVMHPPAIGVAREVFSLDGGEAVLQWPSSINTASVEELEDWLNLVIRKLKRRAAASAEADAEKP